MEATGVYHKKLAYFLESKHCNINIILPNKISNYFRSLEIKTITVRTSSEAITLFCLERNTELWKSPEPAYKSLKQLTRERDQLVDGLRKIYNQNIPKSLAMTKLAHWFKEVEEADFKSFYTLRKTIINHYRDILNYFDQRSTNAAAESFNAKIKNFRMQLRGVKDKTFFLFRLSKLFA